jgi:hypothetical protein
MVFCSHVVLLDGVIIYIAHCYTMLFYVLICYIVLCCYLYIIPYMKSNSLSFSMDRLRLTYQSYQYQLISTKKT